MANSWDHAELGAENGRSQLGDQLLARIGFAASLARKVAVEAGGMPGPVRQLVQLVRYQLTGSK
jgi:hypothetical protein